MKQTVKKRVLLAIALLILLKVSGALGQSSVGPETFHGLTPEKQGDCRMHNNVHVPCERYLVEGKYYLLLYAIVQQEVVVVKVVELHPDGSLKTQKTVWLHPILSI